MEICKHLFSFKFISIQDVTISVDIGRDRSNLIISVGDGVGEKFQPHMWTQTGTLLAGIMAKQARIKTKYAGVYYVVGKTPDGRDEKIYFVRYRKAGKLVEEKAGHQFRDDMTPARAAGLKARRIDGNEETNNERRERERAEQLVDKNRWTIHRLWEEYKEQRSLNKGLVVDANRYDNFLKPIFGKKTPAEIITLDVDRLRINLLKKRSPQTVKHVIALLKRIVSFGAKKGLAPMPDLSKLHFEMPRVDNKKTEYLTPEQFASLLAAIDADENFKVASLVKLAMFSGMRKGELLKLRWNDVDFDRGFINIRESKGGVAQSIPMNNETRKVLENVPRTDSEYVFPGRDGKQLQNVQTTIHRIKKRAGLPEDFRPLHGLRHAYASMLASSGRVDMYTLQKLLTHKSPQMTQRYAHLRDDALKKAADTTDEIIFGMGRQSQTSKSLKEQ